jgi:hypothetical protein
MYERNTGTSASRESPIWLRTCYAKDLAQNYISPRRHSSIVDDRHILDDETLYSHLASDWRQILFRVPSIPDVVHLLGDPNLEEANITDDMYDEPEEEYQRPIYEAERVERTLVYLLDEEALREKVFKVIWLDVHGNCVWGAFPGTTSQCLVSS